MTDYQVKSSLYGGELTANTIGFISTKSCRTQLEDDQYGTVWIQNNVDKVFINFSGINVGKL